MASIAFNILLQVKHAQDLVVLPDRRKLTSRLQEAGFTELLKVTAINRELAGEKISSVDLVPIISAYLCDFVKCTGKFLGYDTMSHWTQKLIEIILADYPKEIEKLKCMGFLKRFDR